MKAIYYINYYLHLSVPEISDLYFWHKILSKYFCSLWQMSSGHSFSIVWLPFIRDFAQEDNIIGVLLVHHQNGQDTAETFCPTRDID